MRTKLLRKLRKELSYRFDGGSVVVSYHKQKRVKKFPSIQWFIQNIAFEYFGIMAGLRYEKHCIRRDNLKDFVKEINHP